LRQHIFFSERVVDRWNGLDQCVIDSDTVNSFKFVQEWVTANATKQDGLLHGLAIGYRPHVAWFWRFSPSPVSQNRCSCTCMVSQPNIFHEKV